MFQVAQTALSVGLCKHVELTVRHYTAWDKQACSSWRWPQFIVETCRSGNNEHKRCAKSWCLRCIYITHLHGKCATFNIYLITYESAMSTYYQIFTHRRYISILRHQQQCCSRSWTTVNVFVGYGQRVCVINSWNGTAKVLHLSMYILKISKYRLWMNI